jgi:hypothetical protein
VVGFRDRLMGWLDRGPAEVPDPDDVIEVANERLSDGPMLVAALRDAGIRAEGFEATTGYLYGSARTRMRIMVRRRDVEAATEIIEERRRR